MTSKQLIQKIKNRAIDFSIYRLPYNQHYRPTGYYSSITGKNGLVESEGASFYNIVPSYPNDLNLQDPFYQQCNPELRPQPADMIPDSFIVSIPNGRIEQNYLGHCTSVISGKNKLIEPISYQTTDSVIGASAADMYIFKQKLFIEPVKYKGTVFSMLAGASCTTNIFHWMYDAVARLFLLKKSGLFDKVDYFLTPALDKKYHTEVLNLLGLEGKKIIQIARHAHIQADNLIVSSHTKYRRIIPKWVCDSYRQLILEKGAPANHSELIYIERGDSKIRQVLNEDKLKELLGKYGFKNVLLSKMPYEQQAKLFASAKVIVSAHGAGLAHLSYCKEGTALLEIFSEHYIKPTYQIISKRRDINYQYMICESDLKGKPKNIREANESHIIADIEEVENRLRQIMSSSTTAKPVNA